MTVTKRKAISRNPEEERTAPKDTGVKFSCDVCSADVSHTVRIRCAQKQPSPTTGDLVRTCEDFDLCASCFCDGKEAARHKRWHDYRVVEQHAYPLFDQSWGADEELLLIDACQSYGLGNWADVADHIGSYRTKEEVQEHYFHTYLNPATFPAPFRDEEFNSDGEEFQKRKKARLEDAQARPLALPPPKPLASTPMCHEVAGFMPGRLEFEHEFENDAETLIKDMEFGLVMRYGGEQQPAAPKADPNQPITEDPTKSAEEDARGNGTAEEIIPEESDIDLELKMTILDIYNERYDRRVETKALILDRALTDYKKNLTNEKKRTRDERELITRLKPFARLLNREDYEQFVDGLIHEMTLRKRIAELQEYRRAGLTSLSEVDRYERDKNAKFNVKAREAAQYDKYGMKIHKSHHKTGGIDSNSKVHLRRFAHVPLSLGNSNSFNLLTKAEKQICSSLRMLPKPYLFIKQTILREHARREGNLTLSEAQALFKIAPEKIAVIWNSLLRSEAFNEPNNVDVDIQEAPELLRVPSNASMMGGEPVLSTSDVQDLGEIRPMALSPTPVDDMQVKMEEEAVEAV